MCTAYSYSAIACRTFFFYYLQRLLRLLRLLPWHFPLQHSLDKLHVNLLGLHCEDAGGAGWFTGLHFFLPNLPLHFPLQHSLDNQHRAFAGLHAGVGAAVTTGLGVVGATVGEAVSGLEVVVAAVSGGLLAVGSGI